MDWIEIGELINHFQMVIDCCGQIKSPAVAGLNICMFKYITLIETFS